MTDEQRAQWDLQFGKTDFPCLAYTQERELTDKEYEALRQHKLAGIRWSKKAFWEAEKKIFEEIRKKNSP